MSWTVIKRSRINKPEVTHYRGSTIEQYWRPHNKRWVTRIYLRSLNVSNNGLFTTSNPDRGKALNWAKNLVDKVN